VSTERYVVVRAPALPPARPRRHSAEIALEHDEDRLVDAFRFKCTCGAVGELRDTSEEALADLDEHMLAAEDEPTPEPSPDRWLVATGMSSSERIIEESFADRVDAEAYADALNRWHEAKPTPGDLDVARLAHRASPQRLALLIERPWAYEREVVAA
jgi:hypothetical protein